MRFALAFLFAGLAASAPAAGPVILISVDTLRADYLGCYGSRRVATPNIDALVKGGTLFAQVNSQAPLTLPSHVSLLTSSYPFQNGVRDNGQVLDRKIPTLAEVFRASGYRTAAFVGGFVLDKRFGLDRGFERYDSPFAAPADRAATAEDLKRLGGEVVEKAERWLESNRAQPFFLFLHLFDLHTPENLPKEFRARYPGLARYEVELAYTDETLGRFFAFLRKLSLYESALIVFTSDHGEGLGDHGENSHGYFIYESTIRVPLIVRWPAGMAGMPARVETPVSLLRVAPTIAEAAGLKPPAEFRGRSLLRELRSSARPADDEIYSESVYAGLHFGAAPIHSLRRGRNKYIHAPRPEFYDLLADPGERNNLYAARPAQLEPLRLRLLAVLKQSAEPVERKPSPEVISRLRSLGYIAGTEAPANRGGPRPDPKDRISDYESYRRGIALRSPGRYAESNQLLEQVFSRNRDLTEVAVALGLNYQNLNEHGKAVDAFRQALTVHPLSVSAHYYAAVSYRELNRLDDCRKELEATLAAGADGSRSWDQITIPAEEMLAQLKLQSGNIEGARAHYLNLLQRDGGNFEANYNLAWILTRTRRFSEAVVHLEAAVRARPDSAIACNALGGLYLQDGNPAKAQKEFERALAIDPRMAVAQYNLGLALKQQGQMQAALERFQAALAIQPGFREAREAIDRLTKSRD